MEKQHYYGHRERVRKRFLEQGLEGFQDYEALELLLLFIACQKDMKPVAKALLEHFDSFKNDLDASAEELEDVSCLVLNKVRRPGTVIDDRVFDRNDDSVALSKNGFAENVLNQVPNLDDLDVSEFEKLFRVISHIIKSEGEWIPEMTEIDS